MNGHTITLNQVQDLRDLLKETADTLAEMIDQIEVGEISPREAADKINNMIEDLANAAK